MSRYIFVLNEDVFSVFLKVRGKDRQDLVRGFEWAADNPFSKGDEVAKDETGRPVQLKRFGRWVVGFWADHFACEVRIVAVSKLKD
jgi:hypothetical protein